MITLILIVIFIISTIVDYIFVKKSKKDLYFFSKHKMLYVLFKVNQDINLLLIVVLTFVIMFQFLCFIF